MRRSRLCVAALAALAGCSSTSATTSNSTTTTTTTTTVKTTSATPSSATSSSATGVQAHAASSACASGQIAVTAGGGGAGVGHVGVVLRFRSTSASTCTLSGYPGATLVTAGRRDLPVGRSRTGYLGGLADASAPVPVVSVRPGQTVSASLEGLDSDPAHGGGPCPLYARLLVTPPNQTVTVRMASPLRQVCRPEIHPVVAGTTGRAG